MTVNEGLRQELLALAEQDQSFLGSPEHHKNSDEVQRQLLDLMGQLRRRLVEILDTYGWPGKSLVREDGAEAAWTLALHTMPEPDVLRRCLTLMRDAAAAGEAERWQVAFLVTCSATSPRDSGPSRISSRPASRRTWVSQSDTEASSGTSSLR
jgi:hypothetical protein